jgi:hypothetical protein
MTTKMQMLPAPNQTGNNDGDASSSSQSGNFSLKPLSMRGIAGGFEGMLNEDETKQSSDKRLEK